MQSFPNYQILIQTMDQTLHFVVKVKVWVKQALVFGGLQMGKEDICPDICNARRRGKAKMKSKESSD